MGGQQREYVIREPAISNKDASRVTGPLKLVLTESAFVTLDALSRKMAETLVTSLVMLSQFNKLTQHYIGVVSLQTPIAAKQQKCVCQVQVVWENTSYDRFSRNKPLQVFVPPALSQYDMEFNNLWHSETDKHWWCHVALRYCQRATWHGLHLFGHIAQIRLPIREQSREQQADQLLT